MQYIVIYWCGHSKILYHYSYAMEAIGKWEIIYKFSQSFDCEEPLIPCKVMPVVQSLHLVFFRLALHCFSLNYVSTLDSISELQNG